MLDSWGSRVVASVVIFVIFAAYRSNQNEKYETYLRSPEGNAQALANTEVEKIKACGEAAKEGAIGPGCQPAPARPVRNIRVYLTPPWPISETVSDNQTNN